MSDKMVFVFGGRRAYAYACPAPPQNDNHTYYNFFGKSLLWNSEAIHVGYNECN